MKDDIKTFSLVKLMWTKRKRKILIVIQQESNPYFLAIYNTTSKLDPKIDGLDVPVMSRLKNSEGLLIITFSKFLTLMFYKL